MHPRLLRTFLAVARHLNITRAAQDVHLAQSSVSDQIQALEAELGASLFSRSRQGLRLTPAGEALKPHAEDILALTDDARAAVDVAAGKTGGSVTIGALETIASAKLPRWLSSFRQAHPGIDLHLKVMGSGDLLRGVEAGAIDVAFCFDKGGADERLARRTVSAEPLVLIVPPGRDLAPGALASVGFVATEPGCIYRHLFETALAAMGIDAPKVAVEAGSIGAIVRLVAAGAGIGVVPRLAAADALDRGEIVELPWPGPVGTAVLQMVWRRRRIQQPALKLLLAAVGAQADPVRPAGVRLRHAAPSLS